MARYISDQNKVLMQHESGTYAVASGPSVWVGEVQSVTVDDTVSPIITRYMGDGDRSVARFDEGPQDITGTISYNPQDLVLLAHALGSVVSVSGTNSTHYVTEINNDVRQSPFTSGNLNPPFSFTIEDSKSAPGTGANFIRTLKGCVPVRSVIQARNGEKLTVDMDYIAQSVAFTSGTAGSAVESTMPAYTFGDVSMTISGTGFETAKEMSFEINQNTVGPHYLNGSRDISIPYMGNRDYICTMTADLESSFARKFYEGLYRGGSEFITVMDIDHDNATGSQHCIITMSGCLIMSMDNPSNVEGTNEVTMEIRPKNVSMLIYDRKQNYNPW